MKAVFQKVCPKIFIRKESSVKVDSGYLSEVGFLVYRGLAYQEQNRFLTGHGPTLEPLLSS